MANYKDIKYQFPTSAVTSGTFADARISSGSVTQHVTATDLQPIKSDLTALALREATNEASAAFNLPNQFIETFTDDTNLGTQTTCDRLSGYMHSKPLTTVTTVVGAGDWTGNTGSFTIGTGTMDTTTGDDSVYITGSEWESGTGDFTFTWVPTSFSGHGGGGGIVGFFDKAEVATFNGPSTDGQLDNMTNSWWIKGAQDTSIYNGDYAYYGGTTVADQTLSHTDGTSNVMKFKRRSGVFSWTENVSEAKWGAEILNYIIAQFPGIKFNLHICGGNAHRKRGYFGRYTDMIEAFKILKVDEIHLEHCSLHYAMLDIFKEWKFEGSISAGVIDQRIDNTETIEEVEKYTEPLLAYFTPDRILLTSECGFGHVPIEITRAKLKKLVESAEYLRAKY